MEELRSTEVLDKEIRADSTKKAARVLSEAQKTAASLIDGVETRLEQAAEAAKKASQEKMRSYEKNLNASLPLEKQRCLVNFVYNSVIESMNLYFDSLDAEKRLEIIGTMIERSKKILEGKKINAVVVGFDKTAAEKMLKDKFGTNLADCSEGKEILLRDEAVKGFSRKEGIILSTDDSKIKCRLTLDEIIKEMLDEKSEELSLALFCGRLPE